MVSYCAKTGTSKMFEKATKDAGAHKQKRYTMWAPQQKSSSKYGSPLAVYCVNSQAHPWGSMCTRILKRPVCATWSLYSPCMIHAEDKLPETDYASAQHFLKRHAGAILETSSACSKVTFLC